MIRSLIVEDASIVRKGIRILLQDERDIEIVGEASDGPEAVERITALQPDLIFLDIQMPGFDGFEVLERTGPLHSCAVIFVTAYADYAMRAFDANALSYLLKPISPARFRAVLQRARTLLGDGQERTSEAPFLRLVVRDGDRFLMLKVDEIDWITSIGEYANVHARKTSYLVRTAISELAKRLDIRQFVRIHRSTIVNLDRVREIQPRSHGDCDVIMHDGTVLRLSRSFRDNLLAQ